MFQVRDVYEAMKEDAETLQNQLETSLGEGIFHADELPGAVKRLEFYENLTVFLHHALEITKERR